VSQIVWGVRTLARYPRFARDVKDRPSEADAHWMQDAIRVVRKGNPKESANLIELTIFSPNAKILKARLDPEGVVLVSKSGDQVLVSARAHFEIAAEAVKGKPMKGTIKPEWLDRYRAWKGEPVEQRMPMAA
jgi:hypothetical protein